MSFWLKFQRKKSLRASSALRGVVQSPNLHNEDYFVDRNGNSCKEEALTCFSFSVTTMRPQSQARLQMKVVNLSCLIFMALTKDCAAVIYWNNTAHKLNKLLLASVQRQLQRSFKCEASISHFNCYLSLEGKLVQSLFIRFSFHIGVV